MTTFTIDTSHRKNNFDIIRLLASIAVMISHYCKPLLDYQDPLGYYSQRQSLGGVGVLIFFTISGYLVSKSRFRSGSIKSFIQNRLLRLLPGLFAFTLFSAFLLGPIVTKVSFSEYFTSTQLYAFLLHIFVFPQNPFLPGVFQDNIDGANLAGPLYTLGLEGVCYIYLCLFGFSRELLRSCSLVAVAVLATILMQIHFTHLDEFTIKLGQTTLFYFPYQLAFPAVLFFLIGVIYGQMSVEFFNKRTAVLLALWIYFSSFNTDYYFICEVITIPYLVISFGLQRWSITNFVDYTGDISYGIYLYHTPIEKAVWHFLHSSCPGILIFVISSIMTCLIAKFSYKWIESPMLKFKYRKLEA